jgi:hypothetical protein
MKKITLCNIIIMASIISVQAQTLNPTNVISAPNSSDIFKGGYTFSYATAGTPWNGALISYGGANNGYDCQISSDYGLNRISFRNYNGDHQYWNPWNEIWHSGNLNNINSDFTAKAINSSKLEIKEGSILVRNSLNTNDSSAIMIAQSIIEGNYTTFGTSIRTVTQSGARNTYGLQFFTQESYNEGQTEKVRILGNGNVGIGTTNPDEKLTVNGKIHAQEVKINLTYPMTVPDYVFANDYKLKSLQEVEEFIKKNSHLPEIPSAKEIEKNGLLLAEMNMSLLKKIEELTLYTIEQNKEIQKQNNKILILEEKVKKIESIKL